MTNPQRMPSALAAPRGARPAAHSEAGVGALLRAWRTRRRRSQLDLALDVGLSTRHLSFIETGRARPSAAMLGALAEALEVPLRDRNQWLLAAGYAPRYAERTLDDPTLARIRESLERLLAAHQPYPGLVLDRAWNVVLANPAAQALSALLPPELVSPSFNVFRASLHPDGLARWTTNFEAWASYLLDTLERAVWHSARPDLQALLEEIRTYPTVMALNKQRPVQVSEPLLLVPLELALPFGHLSLFTTLTTFGSPRDVLLEELCVELFYPADAASEALLRAAADPAGLTPEAAPDPRPPAIGGTAAGAGRC